MKKTLLIGIGTIIIAAGIAVYARVGQQMITEMEDADRGDDTRNLHAPL